jgi:sugar fermentation stimulation protein A
MLYDNIIEGRFIKRINRFVAHVEVGGIEEIVHVKNTGRCAELLIPGASVFLQEFHNSKRKTRYSLIAVYKGDRLVNIDSQVPNQVVLEALNQGAIPEIGNVRWVQREVKFGKSRFDLYVETDVRKGFVEVKGVTLEDQGIALFPDAPTVRGTRHVLEMIDAVKAGYAGYIVFLIQMKDVRYFSPNIKMDPAFANALSMANANGVRILAYDSTVSPNGILIGDPVPIHLPSAN